MVTTYAYSTHARIQMRSNRRSHIWQRSRLSRAGLKPSLASCGASDHDCRMRIADETLDQFIRLYKEEYGEELTRSEASEMAFWLVTLYEALSKRLPIDDVPSAMPPDDAPRQSIGFRA